MAGTRSGWVLNACESSWTLPKKNGMPLKGSNQWSVKIRVVLFKCQPAVWRREWEEGTNSEAIPTAGK